MALKDAETSYALDPANDSTRLSLGAACLDSGRYDEAIQYLARLKFKINADILKAIVYSKKGDFRKAIKLYASIPEEKLSPKNVPLWNDRMNLIKALKPYAASKRDHALKLKTKGRYKEALSELGKAMRAADEMQLEAICREIAAIMAMDPGLAAVPETARKHALRGDVLTEEGNFEDAVVEYRQALLAAPYIAKLYFRQKEITVLRMH